MIKFDKLFKTLKENGISQYSLYTHYGISRAQIQRLKTNQSVTTHTLNVILNILGEGFTLNDIAEFTPDEKRKNNCYKHSPSFILLMYVLFLPPVCLMETAAFTATRSK